MTSSAFVAMFRRYGNHGDKLPERGQIRTHIVVVRTIVELARDVLICNTSNRYVANLPDLRTVMNSATLAKSRVGGSAIPSLFKCGKGVARSSVDLVRSAPRA